MRPFLTSGVASILCLAPAVPAADGRGESGAAMAISDKFVTCDTCGSRVPLSDSTRYMQSLYMPWASKGARHLERTTAYYCQEHTAEQKQLIERARVSR